MRRALLGCYSLLGMLAMPALLCAQDAAANGGGDRATSFQAVSGAVKENVPGGPLLLAAYAVVWLAVLGYVWRLSRLHAGVEERLNSLERALAAAPESPHKPG
jgi:CcmD family protein